MSAVISLFIIIVLSTLITRVATVALVLTGLSRDIARFQARSAFGGTGFTTSESELVVGHPVRRRIVLWLMLLGNVGFVTAISSLLLAFVGSQSPAEQWTRLLWLIVGIAVLWFFATSPLVDRHLTSLIERALERWTDLEIRDYVGLLRLSDDYQIAEIRIDQEDWLAERTLTEAELAEEGVLVLGIHRVDGHYVGAPRGSTRLGIGDTAVLYGRRELLQELSVRAAGVIGDLAHAEAKEMQEEAEEADDR